MRFDGQSQLVFMDIDYTSWVEENKEIKYLSFLYILFCKKLYMYLYI